MAKTPDYAIEIHAKVLYTRFKKSAVEEAEQHAKKLKNLVILMVTKSGWQLLMK